jgi:methionyl-tRNA synthetase
MSKRRLFVTTALPYANGPFHIGHIMEYIQADIWVRFQRMRGASVRFVCADDAHGAPIMIAAEKAGKSPEEFVAGIAAGRRQYLDGFHVAFDHWHSTDSPENTELSQSIYLALRDRADRRAPGRAVLRPGQAHVPARPLHQGRVPELRREGPVRRRLRELRRGLLGDRPEEPLLGAVGRDAGAADLRALLFPPVGSQAASSSCSAGLRERAAGQPRLQSAGLATRRRSGSAKGRGRRTRRRRSGGKLADWDISRDAPYFGIEIPDIAEEKVPLCLARRPDRLPGVSFKKYCAAKKGLDFDALLAGSRRSSSSTSSARTSSTSTCCSGRRCCTSPARRTRSPDHVNVHGFITVIGRQDVQVARHRHQRRCAISQLGMNPGVAALLHRRQAQQPNVEDIDFNPEDFLARVNSATSSASTDQHRQPPRRLRRPAHFEGRLYDFGERPALAWAAAVAIDDEIAAAYDGREFGKVVREVMAVADRVNQRFDQAKPWALAKDPLRREELHRACSDALQAFFVLTVYLAPMLPATARRVAGELFGMDRELDFDDRKRRPASIRPFKHLVTRVEEKQLDNLFDVSSVPQPAAPQRHAQKQQHAAKEHAVSDAITIEDFNKLDLRVARIAKAEHVEGADKLLKLTLDVGGATRTVFAGIKAAYDPAKLEGRLAVLVANLAPRTMKFGVSEGMVLAASGDEPGIFLISPDTGAQPGMRVK